jgi:hypothetical protein
MQAVTISNIRPTSTRDLPTTTISISSGTDHKD